MEGYWSPLPSMDVCLGRSKCLIKQFIERGVEDLDEQINSQLVFNYIHWVNSLHSLSIFLLHLVRHCFPNINLSLWKSTYSIFCFNSIGYLISLLVNCFVFNYWNINHHLQYAWCTFSGNHKLWNRKTTFMQTYIYTSVQKLSQSNPNCLQKNGYIWY